MQKRRSATGKTPIASPFRAELERALDHFDDAQWLGENSPLAAPYLLGAELLRVPDPNLAMSRGLALQRSLMSAAAGLAPNADRRYDPARLLRLTFFGQGRSLNQAGIAVKLGLSPATYYRQRLEALDALEEAFARIVQPVQRLESPLRAQRLVGREHALAGGVANLCQSQCVAISGSSGLGKTSLGAALARMWQAECRTDGGGAQRSGIFWFTFRPGLSDHLNSLLFSLGYFLHQHGAAALWLQMAASQGGLSHELALNLTRDCINKLEQPFLLVLDECDLLIPSDTTTDSLIKLRSFVDGLIQSPRGNRTDLFPVVLIGQNLMVEPDMHIALDGLDAEETRTFLVNSGVELGEADFARLLEDTRGNPLMLNLFVALREGCETTGEALRQLNSSPTAGLLLSRIWRRLNERQREILSLLSVFRGAAPMDMFAAHAQELRMLCSRSIIIEDGLGGVMLPTALREPTLRMLDAETRQEMHLRAAGSLARRSDGTEAAFHYAAAGKPELAVHTWYAARTREISRGNGARALEMFRAISRDALAPADRKVLALVRAELYALVGEAEPAIEEIGAVRWMQLDPLTPDARQLQGDALRMTGQQDAAISAYREGLKSIDAISDVMSAKYARIHATISDALLNVGNLEEAWTAALRARYISDISQGSIQEYRGSYELAAKHYQAAILTSQESGYATDEARAHYNYANVSMRNDAFDIADEHFEAATRIYARIGDQVRLNRCRTSVAAMQILRGNFEAAATNSTEALQFFEQVGHAPWAATNASNLAEAYLGLGRLDEAEHNAMRALNHEDETSRTYALTVLGNVALGRNQPHRAETTLREAIAQAQATKDRWAEAPAWRALAQALRALGRAEEATTALQTALQLYTELGLQRDIDRTRAMLN